MNKITPLTANFFIIVLILVQGSSSSPASVCMTLGDALQKAQTVDLQVVMADARLEQAIARIAEARSDLLPHLDGSVDGGRQTVDLRSEGIILPIPGLSTRVGPFNSFDARARLTMSLFDPSAFERFNAAKKGEDLSEAQLEKTKEDELALVADLFIDAQREEQTVKLIKTVLDRDQMTYQLSQDNLDQGTGTEIDLNKLKSNLDQTKYLYHQARFEAKEALLDLEAALQMPLGEPIIFLDDKDLMKIMEKNTDPNFDHATNADMVVATSQLESNKANEKAAYADLLPKITGNANYGRSGESPSNGSNVYDVGVAVSVPIWEGGQQEAKIRQEKGAVKESQANLKDTVEQEQVNIAKARAAIVEAEYLKESKAQERATAQKSLILAFHAQQIGTGSVLELMQAKADLAQAEDEYNEAQATWVMAHVDLYHAQGRLRKLIDEDVSLNGASSQAS